MKSTHPNPADKQKQTPTASRTQARRNPSADVRRGIPKPERKLGDTDPLDYEHSHPSMRSFAELLALRYNLRGTRYVY